MNRFVLIFTGIWICCLSLLAQGTTEDYNRAFSLESRLKDKVFYSNVTPQWIGHTNCFWYIRNTPQGKIYQLTDAQKKIRKELFNQYKLAVELGLAVNKPIDAFKLPIQSLRVAESLDTLYFVYDTYK